MPPPPSPNATQTTTTAPTLALPDKKLEPPRIVLNAVEGFGKTTAAAYAPDPAILMAGGETGYLTLYGADRAPRVPAVKLTSWQETLAMIDGLIANPQGRKTLALDALGGFERICHEHVCRRDFEDKWEKFMAFHKGYHQAVSDWLQLLQRLDTLRTQHGITILILSHSLVKSFHNPMGDDFDFYAADVQEKTWGVTHKWADAVLFGTFTAVVKDAKSGKGKGIGGTDRIIYTERRDAFNAKNRYGMSDCISIPGEPDKTWQTIWNEITGETNG